MQPCRLLSLTRYGDGMKREWLSNHLVKFSKQKALCRQQAFSSGLVMDSYSFYSRKNRQAASVRVPGFWKNRDLRNQNPSSTMDGLLKAPHKSWEQLAARWELVIWFSWKSAGDGWFSLTISYVTLRIGSSSAFLSLALRTGKFRHRINVQKLREQVRKRRVPT